MKPLASVAFHEAGHIVAMFGLGLPMQSASIEPDDDSIGHVMLDRPPPDSAASDDVREPLDGMTRAQVAQLEYLWCISGPVAEGMAGFTPNGCERDERDANTACDLVHDLTGVPPCRWRHLADAAVERYLRERWRSVADVADALLREKTLTGERVRRLIGDAPPLDLSNIVGAVRYWSARIAARERRHSRAATA